MRDIKRYKTTVFALNWLYEKYRDDITKHKLLDFAGIIQADFRGTQVNSWQEGLIKNKAVFRFGGQIPIRVTEIAHKITIKIRSSSLSNMNNKLMILLRLKFNLNLNIY